MKVRVILHDSDHSVCYDKDGAFKAENQEVTWMGRCNTISSSFDCQHGKKARVQTCELKVPEKECDSVSEGYHPGGSDGYVG